MFDVLNVFKSSKEVYVLEFSGGKQEFILDDQWHFYSQGAYGTYGYTNWYPETRRTFKQFLSQCNSDYLIKAICSPTYFNRTQYRIDTVKLIQQEFLSEASDVLEYFNDNVFNQEDISIATANIYGCQQMKGIEAHYFAPGTEFHPKDVKFFEEIFTAFQHVLKQELTQSNTSSEKA